MLGKGGSGMLWMCSCCFRVFEAFSAPCTNVLPLPVTRHQLRALSNPILARTGGYHHLLSLSQAWGWEQGTPQAFQGAGGLRPGPVQSPWWHCQEPELQQKEPGGERWRWWRWTDTLNSRHLKLLGSPDVSSQCLHSQMLPLSALTPIPGR